jgi:hypothetical protein
MIRVHYVSSRDAFTEGMPKCEWGFACSMLTLIPKQRKNDKEHLSLLLLAFPIRFNCTCLSNTESCNRVSECIKGEGMECLCTRGSTGLTLGQPFTLGRKGHSGSVVEKICLSTSMDTRKNMDWM